MNGVLTAFIIFVLFPGVILGYILLSRYLKYRETLTMIQHGITLPPPMMPGRPMPPPPVVQQANSGGGRGTLIWGLVLAAIGLALTLALWPIGFIANNASGGGVSFPLGLGPWMLAGFAPLFVGLALILGYVITRPERNATLPPVYVPQWTPAPGFPPREGGATRAYPDQWVPGTTAAQGPIVPTEPVVIPEETAAPSSTTHP